MEKLLQAIEKNKKIMVDAADYIWKNAETGYKEYKTTAYLKEQFEKLGYTLTMADGITGFYTVIDTGRVGPTLLILGELDSIICPSHPDADKTTGAVHSCGHHIQSATLLGIAAALKEDGALDGLSGKIKLCAVPAEELLEIEFRSNLMKEGKIKYFGGKPEFMSRGYFDDVDLAFMVHTCNEKESYCHLGYVGCIAKRIIYKGFASHAGGSPHLGKNAFYAATCGINACNALRETFEEKDLIRFHPIMTHGGAMVNAVPERAELETYVRGKTFDGIVKTNKRLNQALIGAALSLDNNVEIIDKPGYAPLHNDKNLIALSEKAFRLANPDMPYALVDKTETGSSDMGDLSAVMPVVHPYINGGIGTEHGNDFYIENPEKTLLANAKWQLVMLYELLKDGGKLAKEIKKEYKPTFPSIKAYLEFMDSLESSGDRIVYSNGKAEARI